MTWADDCAFRTADESKARFLGATGQSPFEMALSPFLLLLNLSHSNRAVFGKGGVVGSLCHLAWAAWAIEAPRSGRGTYLSILITAKALLKQVFSSHRQLAA